jgi:hypothetical protein
MEVCGRTVETVETSLATPTRRCRRAAAELFGRGCAPRGDTRSAVEARDGSNMVEASAGWPSASFVDVW